MKLNVAWSVSGVMFSMLAVSAQTQRPAVNNNYRNQVGLVLGATATPSVGLDGGRTVTFDPSVALGAEYDRRVAGRRTALDLGIDFLASPFDVKARRPDPDVSPQYAYLFLTPHARLHFNANGKLQPWILFGGGYADFAPAHPKTGGGSISQGNKTGALEFGVGIDTKPLVTLPSLPALGKLPVGARVEVRDFYSGKPNYGASTSGFQNSVTFTGGLLLRF